jgi:predicted O-methyltransferase YrrM
MPPPRVIGDGNHETLEGISRAVFTACLIDARVRARSGFIEVEDKALLDYQDEEFARIDDELDFDPAVFHARDGAVWMIEPDPNGATIELDEAFMLLGPHSDGFGHWMLDLLPRYIAASASGALPRVPVLIDASMAETQRQCLELILPEGVEVIALPAFATARVRRLWCAASQMHVPLSAGRGDPPNPGCFAAPPVRFTETVREMARRIEPVAAIATGQDKVHLAGSGQGPAALLNAAEIEAAAVARGFAIVHPDDLSFAEQVRLIRHAEFIVMSEARQVLLSLFAKPGTKLYCLSPDGAEPGLPLRLLDELDVDFTILNGPEDYPDQTGYRIDLATFRESLDGWLGDERQTPNSAQEELEYYLRLSASVPGFARGEEARELARVSFSLPPNAVVVEIGSFLGSGTILLAGARKIRGSGKVHAVDPFDGSGDPVSVPIYEKILAEAGGGPLRGHFDEHIRRAGLSDWVEVHQGRAAEVAARWTTPVDMIFFDGDQSRAGVREAYESWSRFLTPDGIIAVHNSAPDNHRPDHDGQRLLVEEEIRPPHYADIRLVYSTTFARKTGL